MNALFNIIRAIGTLFNGTPTLRMAKGRMGNKYAPAPISAERYKAIRDHNLEVAGNHHFVKGDRAEFIAEQKAFTRADRGNWKATRKAVKRGIHAALVA